MDHGPATNKSRRILVAYWLLSCRLCGGRLSSINLGDLVEKKRKNYTILLTKNYPMVRALPSSTGRLRDEDVCRSTANTGTSAEACAAVKNKT